MFKITIEETKTETKLVRGKYCVVGQKEEQGEYTQKIEIVDHYDYAPDREEEVTTTTKIFEQIVHGIDIKKIIDATNECYKDSI